MKKFIIGSLIIFSSIVSYGQVTGDGLSQATAYYGTLRSGIMRWNLTTHSGGTVYVGRSGTPLLQDLTITEDGMLEIGAGITVVFCTQNSDLRITNAGVLEANGTYSDKITFTRLSGNPLWGHLVFRNNPGPSVLNNCIIENGSANFLVDQYNGGGIFAEANNLTISNCIIRNNTAGASGGGIYANGSVRIENCIIYSNSAGGDDVDLGGGGVYLAGNASLTNSTIIENYSTQYGLGDDVLIASGTARVRNSIIWRQAAYGFSVYFSVAPASSSLTNCAFFEAWNSSYNEIPPDFFTASFILSPVNDASDGPNFNDPASNNYSIKLISPCRDAGTDQGTPPPPSTDFLGNGRSGPYDIGAYEVLYSGWKLTAVSTDWTNVLNWDGGVPTTASDIVIPDGAANYPTATPAPDFTIGTGKLMAIEPGARVTLGVLTNNGILRLNNSATKSASLILSGYLRGAGGTEEIQLSLEGGGTEDDDNFKWHYISVPVASLPVSVFDPADPVDIAQYIESRPTFSLLQGWVDYTGYIYSTGSTSGPKITDLVAGKGYNYWDDTDNTFMLSGDFNLSDVSVNLGFSGNPQLSGFNLLGNPFSSGLDWDYILNSGSFPANTSKALYFTRDNQQATYANGVGIPGDVNGIIPPMQGFFNKTYASGNSISIPLAARTHNNIHDRYKGSGIIPLVQIGRAHV